MEIHLCAADRREENIGRIEDGFCHAREIWEIINKKADVEKRLLFCARIVVSKLHEGWIFIRGGWVVPVDTVEATHANAKGSRENFLENHWIQ